MLALADLKDLTVAAVKDHIAARYETDRNALNRFQFLVAYESVGKWGCDSSSWFLMRDKKTGELFENSGSHCSCYGFDGQWRPEPTSLEYLTSSKFYLLMGGYDEDDEKNFTEVKGFIAKLAGRP